MDEIKEEALKARLVHWLVHYLGSHPTPLEVELPLWNAPN